ncbi:MAG: NADH-quinone oxidoreductase subunit C [Gemmatimonadetes bacterium]|nr:MAG: NADH-quinone oxidoreductase subunit C [Gemmatimonadota bacterium]
MTVHEIYEALRETFGDSVYGYFDITMAEVPAAPKGKKPPKKPVYLDPHFYVMADHLYEVCHALKTEPHFAFDYLMCLSGVDNQDGKLQAVYHLFSYSHQHKVAFKVDVPLEAPNIPTVSSLWAVANWFEREIYDLFGIQFTGHPALRRLLLPDDWEGHPLRKDYVKPTHYHGLDNTRDPWEEAPANLLAGQTEPTEEVRRFTELGLQTNRTDKL